MPRAILLVNHKFHSYYYLNKTINLYEDLMLKLGIQINNYLPKFFGQGQARHEVYFDETTPSMHYYVDNSNVWIVLKLLCALCLESCSVL